MNKPTIPKGTRDFGPLQVIRRHYIFDIIRNVFLKFGFQPIETPAMENLDTLTGKYGEEGDQLLFKILNSGDFLKDINPQTLTAGNNVLAMQLCEKGLRYDLTVPFARYVVMNKHLLSFPFKRYQIQPVWRADRPQRGRYREFYQCDADVVGTHSLICEAEVVMMINEVFASLGLNDYSIKINHRDILTSMAAHVNTTDVSGLFTALDKIDKIGYEKVKDELTERGFTSQQISTLFQFLSLSGNENIEALSLRFAQTGQRGVQELKEIIGLIKASGLDTPHLDFDITLARGLSYYTGCIFEVKIAGVSVGSVCGGGRYDNLTGVFDANDKNSGVGISFGVDRIYDALEELKLFPPDLAQSSTVLLCHFTDECMMYAMRVLAQLRQQGIAGEIYPDRMKIQKQLEYAHRKTIPYVILIGEDEMAVGVLSFKNMKTGEQEKKRVEEIINIFASC